MMRNIKLIIEYDGTDFEGWQRQPQRRTVQEEIEKSFAQITQAPVSVVGAGRTDSGVHALGQVANALTTSTMSTDEFKRSLNGTLPEDIVVHSVQEVEKTFSARYSAKEREYLYRITNHETSLDRKYVWQLGYELDLDLMNRAAQSIIGSHDFQAFCKTDADVEHFRCILSESRWFTDGKEIHYRVRGNRFLHGMVRALVGTMVDIGRGHTNPEEFAGIIDSKKRAKAGQSAPAKGLYLIRVTY